MSIVVKKVNKKSPKKSSVKTLDNLRKNRSGFTVSGRDKKILQFLIENKGKEFTSYQIHAIIEPDEEKSKAKRVRDFMRRAGLNKNTSFVNSNSNQGVVMIPEEFGHYALKLSKLGHTHLYSVMDVK